jgi:uncharacterized membrane protein YczE
MSKQELFKRYLFFAIGLFVSAFGVSLITKASLGTSPISSIPYTLSLGLPFTMGTFTFLLNMVLIAGQIIFQKKDFQKIQLLQIPVSVLFGYFIDFTMSMLSFLNPSIYVYKVLFLLAGCIVLALGVSIEVVANVVMLSGEAFVNAISLRFKKDFGITKVFFDATLVICSIIISLMIFGNVSGVREGTIIAALIVGFIARFFNRLLRFVDEKILKDTAYVCENNVTEEYTEMY